MLQQEQVTDPVQVDLLTRVLAEASQSFQAALAELDVDLVGEHRPHPAGGLAGRASTQGTAVEQENVADPSLDQVEGGAHADHSAADDDDGCVIRQGHGHGRSSRRRSVARSWRGRPFMSIERQSRLSSKVCQWTSASLDCVRSPRRRASGR